jgi:hypothetical protein
LYLPGNTFTNEYRPLESLVVSLEIEVSRLVNVTMASGMTDPEGSDTVPTTEP